VREQSKCNTLVSAVKVDVIAMAGTRAGGLRLPVAARFRATARRRAAHQPTPACAGGVAALPTSELR